MELPAAAERSAPALSPYQLSLVETLSIPLVAESGASVRWESIFGRCSPLRVEIGVGNSEFLIQVALRDPQFNYLGFEYSQKRVTKFLKRVEERGLTSIRVIRDDVVPLLPVLFQPGSVDRVFVNFPDPWPKRRHAKNRFVQESNLRLLEPSLAPDGGLSLRTDSEAYARQMLAVCDGLDWLENLAGPGNFTAAPREPFETAYERKYRLEGRRIHYLEYRRRKRA